jgi:hypothetical protein
MDSVDLLSPFQMFAGLSPDELRPVAGTAGEVEIAADAAVTTSTW